MKAPQIVHHRAPDGTRLAVRVWDCREPVGHVILLHGITSHGGWYAATCSRLAAAGLGVHFLDRRGSGLNASSRGDVDEYPTWVRDVEHYLQSLRSDLGTVLVGISWGGKLAVAVAQSRGVDLAGLALVCPGLFARQYPGLVKRLLVRAGCSVGLSTRGVAIPLEDPRLFTDDPDLQQFILRDPLALRQLTLRFVRADLELTRQVQEEAERVHAPTLLQIAGRDPIVDNHKVREFVERFSSRQKRVIEYPDAGHTLEFDERASGYADDLAGWACGILRTARHKTPQK